MLLKYITTIVFSFGLVIYLGIMFEPSITKTIILLLLGWVAASTLADLILSGTNDKDSRK